MTTDQYSLDWSELAFGNKKAIRELKATFILAPREISSKRFKQLVKEYLPKGNIILGLAKEAYIVGFEGQPQFRTLRNPTVASIIQQVNAASKTHKIYSLNYAQREAAYVIDGLRLKKVLAINGSWQYAFHTRELYYALVNDHVEYDLLSPFCDEAEAHAYEKRIAAQRPKRSRTTKGLTDAELMNQALLASQQSYDYNFQTGAALSLKQGKTYKLLATSFNKVVPFQTYALHYGASREKNFSPPHDLNHYDTVHAEVMMILQAQAKKIDLKKTTLHINLLPCPVCARMLSQTDIAEIVYELDHSDGYAADLLIKAGKIVRRLTAKS